MCCLQKCQLFFIYCRHGEDGLSVCFCLEHSLWEGLNLSPPAVLIPCSFVNPSENQNAKTIQNDKNCMIFWLARQAAKMWAGFRAGCWAVPESNCSSLVPHQVGEAMGWPAGGCFGPSLVYLDEVEGDPPKLQMTPNWWWQGS